MKAHVINLPHRTDRRKAMEAQCDRLNLEPIFFEATNGKVAFASSDPRPLMQGHFGCLDSHKRLLESLHGTSNDHLILEDDAVLDDSFLNEYFWDLPLDVALLFLGGNITQMEGAVGTSYVYPDKYMRAYNVLCTHAYIIKDEAIPQLLEVLNSRQWKVDILFAEFQKVANCYITKKCLAWQAVSHSDITDQTLDGTKLKY